MALHRGFRTDQAEHTHSTALHAHLLLAVTSPDLFHAHFLQCAWVRTISQQFKTPRMPEER